MENSDKIPEQNNTIYNTNLPSSNMELVDVENEIRKIKMEIMELENSKYSLQTEEDIDEKNAEIVSLEIRLESYENMRNNLLEWIEYKKNCSHDYVLDLVDINPDKSTVIKYCKHCLHVPSN